METALKNDYSHHVFLVRLGGTNLRLPDKVSNQGEPGDIILPSSGG